MTGAQSLELRGLIGAIAAAGSATGFAVAPRIRVDRSRFRQLVLAGFAVSRVGLYLIAFFIFHLQPRGDVELYMQEGASAYHHQLVYRDFSTPHAPLSPYLFSAMLHLRYDARTIILFSIVFDVGAFALWQRFSARMPDALTERRALLLMLSNPVSLLTVAIDGQMNALIALGLAWSAVELFERRNSLSGFAAAIPGVLVKFLSWIFAPILFFASRRRLVWCAGFLVLTLAVYAAFAVAGADIFFPIHVESAHKTTSNVTFLIELLTGADLGDRLPDLALAMAWLAVLGVALRAMRRSAADETAQRRMVLFGLIAVMMVVQVFSKNTWDRYLVMTMYPLCWLAAELTTPQIALYCIWLVVNVTYRSAWSSLTGESSSLVLHWALLRGSRLAESVLAGEVLQTAGNIALLAVAVHRLFSDKQTTAIPSRVAAHSFESVFPDAAI